MQKMKSYCLKCRKDTENINPRVSNISNAQLRSFKNQDAKSLLNNLGVRTPLSEVPILGDILF